MKLFTKTENDGTKTSFDVSAITVAGAAGVLTIVQALSTLLASWFVTFPNNRTEIKLKEKNFQIQMFQRILESDTKADRANSLKLLIAAELLDDTKGEITKIADDSLRVPKWPAHQIESMGGTFTTLPTTSPPTTTSSTSQPNDTSKNRLK